MLTRDAETALATGDQTRLNIADARRLHLLESVSRTIARVGLIATDLSGVITWFNYGAEMLTGYTAAEVIDRHTPLLLHLPEEVDAQRRTLLPEKAVGAPSYQVYSRHVTDDGIEELQCTYVRKDGIQVAVYLAIQVMLDATGSLMGHLSTVRPVPPRKPQDSVHVFRFGEGTGGGSVPEGVLSLAYDWSILYRDQRALEILSDLEMGKNIWELYPALLGTYVEQHMRDTMENRRRSHYENYYAPLDAWFKVSVVPSATGIKIFFQDITQAKKIDLKLQREQILREKRIEALSHMAGGLAHEISNPLAIINMMANDLETFASEHDVVDAAEVKTTCAIILETSNRAMAILRGLKGFAREASKDPMVEAYLPKIIEDCLELQQSRFERNGIELRVMTGGPLPTISCREVQIGQIINNMLNNAFDAIVATITSTRANGGWVCIQTSIQTTPDGDAVRIDVTDSGPGVPEEARPHLMEPFFTTKEIGGGTGIGLSLSRAIAEDHGGTLVLVEDPGPTCFRLVLPVHQVLKREDVGADKL